MKQRFSLQPGEKLLLKAAVTFIGSNPLQTKVGVVYLTTMRVVAEQEGLFAGVFGMLSVIFRTLFKRFFSITVVEWPLRSLIRVRLQKYGVNRLVVLSLGDGTELRIAFSGKTRLQFLQLLDEALSAVGLARTPEGEESWRIRPAM